MAFATVAAKRTAVAVLGFMASVTVGGQRRFFHVPDGMAGVARRLGMASCQAEFRIVVIETGMLPFGHVMALPAAGPKPALMSVLLGVACSTRKRRVLIELGFVAGVALGIGVLAAQWEPGQGVIVLGVLLPARLAMARQALLAELFLMDIVLGVARHARGRELNLMRVLFVAFAARRILMFAQQRELGVFVVIEGNIPPSACFMTTFALRTVAFLMNVLLLMATRARNGNALIPLTGMAELTGNVGMRAGQRKFRGLVIERLRLCPGVRRVTARTIGSKLALVNVV